MRVRDEHASTGLRRATSKKTTTNPTKMMNLHDNVPSSTPSTSAQPRRIVYAVTEKGEKTYWTRIGMAFTNRDNSVTVRLDAIPVNGILQIRDEDPARRGGGAQ